MANQQRNIIRPVTPAQAPVAPVVSGRKYKLTAAVSAKGCVSIYGIRRFPIALYRDEWLAIFAHVDKIAAFMEANADQLAVKEEKAADDKGRTAL